MDFIICASKREDMKAIVTDGRGCRMGALSTIAYLTGTCTADILNDIKSP